MRSLTIKFDYNPEAFYSGRVVPIALYMSEVAGDTITPVFNWKGIINYMEEKAFPEILIPPGNNPPNRMSREDWLALQPCSYLHNLVIPLIKVLSSNTVIYSTDLDKTVLNKILNALLYVEQ